MVRLNGRSFRHQFSPPEWALPAESIEPVNSHGTRILKLGLGIAAFIAVSVYASQSLSTYWARACGGAGVAWLSTTAVHRWQQQRRDRQFVDIVRQIADGNDRHIPAAADVDKPTAVLGVLANTIQMHLADLESQRDVLEERTRMLQTVFSAMVEGVIAFDASERVLFANHSAMPFLDVDSTEVVGRLMLEVSRSVSIHEIVHELLDGKEGATAEIEIGRSGRSWRVLARQLPGSPCAGVVLIFHDVTEVRRLEVIRSEFVANVSHELKTPLSSISAFAETLLDGAIDDAEHNRRFVGRIEEQAKRLHEIVIDLLSLARIESQQAPLETERVSLATAAEQCIADHRHLVDSACVKLEIVSQSDVHLFATKLDVQAILNNLVANAIKFTQAGSIRLGWAVEAGAVRIEVEDTGIGIAEENQARVFERFFRTDAARSRDVGGTGLGLSIVKHTAQSLGGRVELHSELGVGSRFSVILPTADS